MAEHGANLQTFNNDLVTCLEDLRIQKEEILSQVLREEEQKSVVEKDIKVLSDRLNKINDSLGRKKERLSEVDKVIMETELAYKKIIDSAGSLLAVLKRETHLEPRSAVGTKGE